jgi:hypothetical protein
MTSAGNPEQIDKAKRILRNAAIGLVIILSAFSIVSFIINALENATALAMACQAPAPATAAKIAVIWYRYYSNVYPSIINDVALIPISW